MFFSSGKKKNSKAARLRKLQAKIRKEEKKKKLDSDLIAAEKKLASLRRR